MDSKFTEADERFIDEQLATGRYESRSDVLQAGVRLLIERDRERAALRAALKEGIESGVSEQPLDEFWNDIDALIEQRGA